MKPLLKTKHAKRLQRMHACLEAVLTAENYKSMEKAWRSKQNTFYWIAWLAGRCAGRSMKKRQHLVRALIKCLRECRPEVYECLMMEEPAFLSLVEWAETGRRRALEDARYWKEQFPPLPVSQLLKLTDLECTGEQLGLAAHWTLLVIHESREKHAKKILLQAYPEPPYIKEPWS